MEELGKISKDELLQLLMLKFRHIGGYQEGILIDPERKRNMKPPQVNVATSAEAIEMELENLKKKILEAKRPGEPTTIETIENLK